MLAVKEHGAYSLPSVHAGCRKQLGLPWIASPLTRPHFALTGPQVVIVDLSPMTPEEMEAEARLTEVRGGLWQQARQQHAWLCCCAGVSTDQHVGLAARWAAVHPACKHAWCHPRYSLG